MSYRAVVDGLLDVEEGQVGTGASGGVVDRLANVVDLLQRLLELVVPLVLFRRAFQHLCGSGGSSAGSEAQDSRTHPLASTYGSGRARSAGCAESAQ